MARRKKTDVSDGQQDQSSNNTEERKQERINQEQQRQSEQKAIASFFGDNWKHRSAVQRNRTSTKTLASGVLSAEFIACIMMCTLAGQNSTWELVVPAITSSVYVAAGINNANESQVQPFLGFFDSTFMSITNVLFLASMIYMGPGGLLFLIATLPFMFDGVTSFMRHREDSQQQLPDVNNIPLIMSDEYEAASEGFNQPSENLPEVIRENRLLSNVFISQWKDGAFEPQEPLSKQLIALALIFIQGYLGGMIAYEGPSRPLGIFTLIYALLGFLGYFNFAPAPLAQAVRVNAAPLVLGGSTALVMAGGGSSALSMGLLAVMMADFLLSFRDWGKEAPQNHAQQEEEPEQRSLVPQGPVANFFLRSWKNGAYTKGSEFVALLMVGIMFLQLYFVLISFTDSAASLPLNMSILASILASMYAFFGYPVEVAGVNLLQSNASQGALLLASGAQMLTVGAGAPFVVLSGLLALDFAASMTVYFSQNQESLARRITSSAGVSMPDSKGDDDFSSLR